MTDEHQKVTANHLKRNAYLYVRQSSVRQVFENTESTKRQYALRQRAIALGWPTEHIIVIDNDLGRSGASAADRRGFQKLVAEVGMGKAGIVMGLEVSRLARNSTDWHRLLEICALTQTLILDEDGLYDPQHFNDRLLLGLKGTMSEAELHLLSARLRGGVLNKARRGELQSPLPVGFVYDEHGQVVLDPDDRSEIHPSLFPDLSPSWVGHGDGEGLSTKGILFPRRLRTGPRKARSCGAILRIHERCGFFTIPGTPEPSSLAGHAIDACRTGAIYSSNLPRDEWTALIRDAHPGYITWEQFERNQDGCAPTPQLSDWSADEDRQGRVQHCFRGLSSVASAAVG